MDHQREPLCQEHEDRATPLGKVINIAVRFSSSEVVPGHLNMDIVAVSWPPVSMYSVHLPGCAHGCASACSQALPAAGASSSENGYNNLYFTRLLGKVNDATSSKRLRFSLAYSRCLRNVTSCPASPYRFWSSAHDSQ